MDEGIISPKRTVKSTVQDDRRLGSEAFEEHPAKFDFMFSPKSNPFIDGSMSGIRQRDRIDSRHTPLSISDQFLINMKHEESLMAEQPRSRFNSFRSVDYEKSPLYLEHQPQISKYYSSQESNSWTQSCRLTDQFLISATQLQRELPKGLCTLQRQLEAYGNLFNQPNPQKLQAVLERLRKKEESLGSVELTVNINGTESEIVMSGIITKLMEYLEKGLSYFVDLINRIKDALWEDNMKSLLESQQLNAEVLQSNIVPTDGLVSSSIIHKVEKITRKSHEQTNAIDYYLATSQTISQCLNDQHPSIAFLSVTQSIQVNIHSLAIYCQNRLFHWTNKEDKEQLKLIVTNLQVIFVLGVRRSVIQQFESTFKTVKGQTLFIDFIHYFSCFHSNISIQQIKIHFEVFNYDIVEIQKEKDDLVIRARQGESEASKLLKLIMGHEVLCLRYVLMHFMIKISNVATKETKQSLPIADYERMIKQLPLIIRDQTDRLMRDVGLSENKLRHWILVNR